MGLAPWAIPPGVPKGLFYIPAGDPPNEHSDDLEEWAATELDIILERADPAVQQEANAL